MDAQFELESVIKTGFFGVYIGTSKGRKCVAYDTHDENSLSNEKKKLLFLSHKNIVLTYEAKGCYILLEYAECGSLEKYLHAPRHQTYHGYKILDALNWALQIAEGLDYLHSNKILICVDLNPKRLLLFQNYTCVKINVLSIMVCSARAYEYVAPEAITMTNCSQSCDIYSFGIVFWELLTLKKPFYHMQCSIEELKSRVLKGYRPLLSDVYKLDVKKKVLQDFFEACWNSNPKKRQTFLTENIKILIDYYARVMPHVELPATLQFIQESVDEKLQIGKGSFGVVYKAIWKNATIALKKIDLKGNAIILPNFKHIEHSNVINIYEIVRNKNVIYLLMEYAECGNLYEFLRANDQYSVERALHWMRQAVEGVIYLNDRRKEDPSIRFIISTKKCFLFSNSTLKISVASEYYRECAKIELNKMQRNMFTFEFTPEDQYTEVTCVYSFGIFLWELMSRKTAYYHLNHLSDDVLKLIKIKFGERPLLGDIRKCKNDFVEKLIQNCWHTNPAKRPTLSELSNILHEFETLDKQIASKIDYKPVTVDFSEIKCLKFVGRGSFGVVREANWRNKQIAVKEFIGLNDIEMKNFEKEARQLSRVNHTNIVKIYGISFANESAYLLIEYADCGSLYTYLHGDKNNLLVYTMADGINWLIQCIMGISYLHKITPKAMVHRDLKPHNLLLSNNFKRLQIGDFGTVTDVTNTMTPERGTPAYIAPEVCEGNKYTEKCDIYSFGVIVWEVMARKKPFSHLPNPTLQAIMFNTVKGVRPPLSDIKVCDCKVLQQIIEKCWDPEPNNRPNAEDIELHKVPQNNLSIL